MIYLVTNRKLVVREFEDVIEEALQGGVGGVILREKDLRDDELLCLATRIKKLTDRAGVPLIINHSLYVTRKTQAYAYHTSFKTFMNKGKTYPRVGVSIHSLEEGLSAQKNGADYVLAGHIFPTDCKKNLPPRGLNFIKELRAHLTIPVIAIGGITPENASAVYKSGAHSVAVMSYIMNSSNPIKRVQEFKEG